MGYASQPLQCGDIAVARRSYRKNTRPHRAPIDDHRARAALGKTAAKPGAVEFQVVAQNIEEGRGGIRLDAPRLAIHLQRDLLHASSLSSRAAKGGVARVSPATR